MTQQSRRKYNEEAFFRLPPRFFTLEHIPECLLFCLKILFRNTFS